MQGRTIKNFQKIHVKKLTRKKQLFDWKSVRKAERKAKQQIQERYYGQTRGKKIKSRTRKGNEVI